MFLKLIVKTISLRWAPIEFRYHSLRKRDWDIDRHRGHTTWEHRWTMFWKQLKGKGWTWGQTGLVEIDTPTALPGAVATANSYKSEVPNQQKCIPHSSRHSFRLCWLLQCSTTLFCSLCDICHWFGTHLDYPVWSQPKVLNPMTPKKTLSPNKATFTGSRGRVWHIVWATPDIPTTIFLSFARSISLTLSNSLPGKKSFKFLLQGLLSSWTISWTIISHIR